MGFEGFSGLESILYHLHSPCRVVELGEFEPIVRDEWVPDAHAHRHFTTWDVPAGGDAVDGRQLLMWNDDVEISLCRPTESMQYFFRNGEGDEVIFVHEGSGTLETIVRRTAVLARRLHRRPARHDVPVRAGGRAALPGVRDAGADHDPEALPQRARAADGARAVLPPRPAFADRAATRTASAASTSSRCGCATATRRTCSTTTRSTSSAGTATCTRGRSRSTTSSRSPGASTCRPRAHQTFQGPNFVICSFCPRKLDFDPNAVPIPYHHSNLQSEEMIYYVDGNVRVAASGIEVGSITLHPTGLPHGPQPGLAEKIARAHGDARARGDVRHVPPAASDRARG